MSEPGWHPDPLGRSDRRYYDGDRWTEHIVDASGAQSVDPLGIDPSPEPSGATDAGASEAPGAAPTASGPVIGTPPPRPTAAPTTPAPGEASPPAGTGAPADPDATSVFRAEPLPPPPAEEPVGADAPTEATPAATSGAPGAPAAAAGAGLFGTPAPSPGSATPPPSDQQQGALAQPAWGAHAWGQPGHGGPAPQGRVKKVDKISVVGLVLAVLGIALGVLSLFALPWIGADGIDLGGEDGFSEGRELAETGILGALAGGLLINLAYFTVFVGGAIALGKALGSRAVGVAALVVAVIGLVVLSVMGFSAIDDAGVTTDAGTEVFEPSGTFGDDPEDRLTGTAIYTTVVMVLVVVMAGIGLLLHGIAGRILAFLGLGLLVPLVLGGALVLVGNLDDLVGGFVDVSYSLKAGAWALVGSAALLAIASAVPGGSKQTQG